MNESLAQLSQLHFLRPEWFYALVPAVLLYLMLKYRQSTASNWEKAVDSNLLPYLLDNPDGAVSRSPMTLLLVAWLLAVLALAGPVWQKTDQPVHEREDALVILLDLTRSMYATDVKPNRLVRARRKLQDLLNLRN
jgi:Ca-activated chloride channel family protein